MAELSVISVLSVASQIAAVLVIGVLLYWLLLVIAESRLRWRAAFDSLAQAENPASAVHRLRKPGRRPA